MRHLRRPKATGTFLSQSLHCSLSLHNCSRVEHNFLLRTLYRAIKELYHQLAVSMALQFTRNDATDQHKLEGGWLFLERSGDRLVCSRSKEGEN